LPILSNLAAIRATSQVVAFHSLVGTWRLSTNSSPIFCALSFRLWPRTRESEQLCLISHIATPLLGHLYAAVPLSEITSPSSQYSATWSSDQLNLRNIAGLSDYPRKIAKGFNDLYAMLKAVRAGKWLDIERNRSDGARTLTCLWMQGFRKAFTLVEPRPNFLYGNVIRDKCRKAILELDC